MGDQPYENDLQYLEDELEWIELRCKRIITQGLIDEMSGDDEAGVYYNQSYYGPRDQSLEALIAKRDSLEKRERKLRLRTDSRLSVTRQAGTPVALDQLVELYGLGEFERTVILLAASVTFSRRFVQMYGRIWNGYEALVVETVFSFCELSFAERIEHLKHFSQSNTLFRNELVTLNLGARIQSPQELLDAQLRISNRTFDFIVGDEHFMDEFMDFSSVEEPRARFEQVVLDERDKERILSVVERHDHYLECRQEWGFDDIISYGKGVLMLFYGKPGTGKTMMAHAVAREMGMRVLNVDIPTFINHFDAQRFLPALFREAKMQNAILFFDECEALFATRTQEQGNPLMTLLLTEIERFEGVAILATNLPQKLDEALERRILVRVNFPQPDRAARRDIWRTHLPPQAPLSDDVDVEALADQFELAGGYIKNAVLMAVADAVHRGGDDPKITMAALQRAAREQVTPTDGEQSPVTVARVQLDDVILGAEQRSQVDELLEAVRNHRTVMEAWDVGHRLSYGAGISGLLWGPSGTGKSLCAEAIAEALNRPMRTVSLAGDGDGGRMRSVLERAFDEAHRHNAVLIIDHVDAQETSGLARWLASRLERHEGVVLLLSARPPAQDSPLAGRVNYLVELARPDAAARAEIWRTLLDHEALGTDGAVDYATLGREFELTGESIRTAALRAAFRAARSDTALDMELLRETVAELSPVNPETNGVSP
jgi:SpoVK/Ycf46/Vps4 family AAA+-type ATPase